jgi:hypothetical protein
VAKRLEYPAVDNNGERFIIVNDQDIVGIEFAE